MQSFVRIIKVNIKKKYYRAINSWLKTKFYQIKTVKRPQPNQIFHYNEYFTEYMNVGNIF